MFYEKLGYQTVKILQTIEMHLSRVLQFSNDVSNYIQFKCDANPSWMRKTEKQMLLYFFIKSGFPILSN